jgi:hypothetical protein
VRDQSFVAKEVFWGILAGPQSKAKERTSLLRQHSEHEVEKQNVHGDRYKEVVKLAVQHAE